MRRVSKDDLTDRIYVELKVLPKFVTARLRSKLAQESDEAARAIAEHLVRKLDGDSIMVIEADPIDATPYGQRPGRFGVDEPDPAAQ